MYDRRTRRVLSGWMADAFLAGAWNERAMVARVARSLDRRPRWLLAVTRDVVAAYHRPPADRPRELAAFIAATLQGRPPVEDELGPPQIRRWWLPVPAMGRRRWPVPEIASVGQLVAFLELESGELAWLADARGWERAVADETLRHYTYRLIARRDGPPRVVESPKARLKAVQRRILHEILDWIPAHDAAHGFTRGRSVVTHAARHTGKPVLTGLDLKDFFASINAGRVFGILLATPHLPPGAPTSPALANLAAFGLDRRLAGLARTVALTYSRDADDIALSGAEHLATNAPALRATIAMIAGEEGFVVNSRRSHLTTRGGRQQVCGTIVNEHPNVPRADCHALKAILHNAQHHGPASQNRAGVPDFHAHLLGRIAWMGQLHPRHGRKLRRQLHDIPWNGSSRAQSHRPGRSKCRVGQRSPRRTQRRPDRESVLNSRRGDEARFRVAKRNNVEKHDLPRKLGEKVGIIPTFSPNREPRWRFSTLLLAADVAGCEGKSLLQDSAGEPVQGARPPTISSARQTSLDAPLVEEVSLAWYRTARGAVSLRSR